VRRLQHRRSSSSRARIERAARRQGKTVKILTVGKKGREQLKRDFADKFVGHVDLSEVNGSATTTRRRSPRRADRRFEAGEFDVATIFYSKFQSVISQVPTAQQIIPATFEAEDAEVSTLYDYEPSEEAILADLLPRGVATADLRRAAGERRLRTGRADVGDGQRDAQRGRDDRQADDRVQPLAPGRHHQRADRDHFGRRGALTEPETSRGRCPNHMAKQKAK
jgi:hypothetical protein